MSERPILKLDLSGSDGNVFVVMGLARTMLAGSDAGTFRRKI